MKEIRCARCRRKLHGLKARAMGIGTTCARKNPALAAKIMAEAAGQLPLFSEPKEKESA